MRIEEHIDTLRAEGELFADAMCRADLTATVPTCPEWTVGELARHTGRVHRWAATYVRQARPEMMTPDEEERAWGAMPADASLVDWLRDGHTRLVDALTAAAPDLACWTFLPQWTGTGDPPARPREFWARRQAHETTVHRVDAQLAAKVETSSLSVRFAVDGLDELLLGFFSRRRNRLRFDTPASLAVFATDADVRWLVQIGPDGAAGQRCRPEQPEHAAKADATLAGPAAELYLGLWNRAPLGRLGPDRPEPASAVVVSGDAGLIDLWRRKATITWS